MDAAETPPESLHRQVRLAIMWRGGSQVAGQLIAWASTFVVIRVLAPADYGLVAMTGVVLVLLNMLNGHGLANALIQHSHVTRREQAQVFGMLVLLNGALGIGQWMLAPIVAAYYREPMVAQLLRVQSVLYLATPFSSLAYAMLARRMEFHRQAQVNLLSSIAGAIAAIAGAYAGLGVWTLVLAPATLFATRAIGLTIVARSLLWPSFDFRGAAHLARYGGIVAGASLLGFAQSQADVLIAGRWFDARSVGIYTTALFLTQIFTNKVIPPLNEIAFSAYARMQDDPAAVARGFIRAARLVTLVAIPFFYGLLVTADPLVPQVLGPQWTEAAPLVRILAVAMPFMALQTLFPAAVDALGRPGVTARTSAIGAVLLPVAFLAGAQFGIVGLSAAWIVAQPVLLVIVAWRALPVLGLSAGQFIKAIAPAFTAGLVMIGCTLLAGRFVRPLGPVPQLMVLIGVGGVAYLGSLALFARDALRDAVAMVRAR